MARMPPSIPSACSLALLALLAFPRPVTSASPRPAAEGSAIDTLFSIHPNTLRPAELLTLQACVANDNAHSRRALEAGDSFVFQFTRGVLHDCLGVDLTMDGMTMAPSDWECSATDNALTLTYVGGESEWPPALGACATILYVAEDRPTTIRTIVRVAQVGKIAPAVSPSLTLGVGRDIGIPGPEGPRGPAGPAGPGGVGQRAMAHSTDVCPAMGGGPPEPIPGLTLRLDCTAGSQLLISLDAATSDCTGTSREINAVLYLEVDGIFVASRGLAATNLVDFRTATLTWLTPPLSPGEHVVRAWGGPAPGSPARPFTCLGVGSPGDIGNIRLVALEILP